MISTDIPFSSHDLTDGCTLKNGGFPFALTPPFPFASPGLRVEVGIGEAEARVGLEAAAGRAQQDRWGLHGIRLRKPELPVVPT